MVRKYLIDGVPMTAEQVGAIENPTDSQKKQFVQQSGMSDARLREIEVMVEAIVPPIREYIVEAIAPLVDRISQLESRAIIPWEGPWDPEREFPQNCFCSFQGGMWFAAAASKGVRPGTGDGVWRLAVKAGKDGKDLRR